MKVFEDVARTIQRQPGFSSGGVQCWRRSSGQGSWDSGLSRDTQLCTESSRCVLPAGIGASQQPVCASQRNSPRCRCQRAHHILERGLRFRLPPLTHSWRDRGNRRKPGKREVGAKKFPQEFRHRFAGFCPVRAGCGSPPRAGCRKQYERETRCGQFAIWTRGRAARSFERKPADKRTLAEYKQVVNSYHRVYLITPHATQVPDALVAVAELNSEMGDRFGRSYYQTAVESYQFLIKEYPTSKYVPDAMLSIAKLEKNQLGDSALAAKGFQDYLKKYPHSPRKREVQEELAELALMKNAETGQLETKDVAPTPAPAPERAPVLRQNDAYRTHGGDDCDACAGRKNGNAAIDGKERRRECGVRRNSTDSADQDERDSGKHGSGDRTGRFSAIFFGTNRQSRSNLF